MITPIVVAFAVGLFGLAYQVLKPPPPKICGSKNGPPVTSSRVKLNDGRHLAYRESGVPKEEAQHKIIILHGFNSSKDVYLPAPQELVKELKIYFLFFDRAGYGESDPYPSRSVKSDAFDIQELADKLQLGSKFYVIGCSMGAYPVWSCLKYIPHRLLGVSLVVPFVNYWWHSFPSNLSKQTFKKLPQSYQRTFCIAHYTPWLFYWWMTQKWFVQFDSGNMLTDSDLEVLKMMSEHLLVGQEKISQQGAHESLHRDILAAYGKWEFDPLVLSNPFPQNEGSVHIWQGYEDRVIPFELNRFISKKLAWIHYHEIPDAGHMLIHDPKHLEAILRALLIR